MTLNNDIFFFLPQYSANLANDNLFMTQIKIM